MSIIGMYCADNDIKASQYTCISCSYLPLCEKGQNVIDRYIRDIFREQYKLATNIVGR